MIGAILLMAVGTPILMVGGAATVRGARTVAGRSGLPPLVLGIVALGIEVGSLGTAVVAAGRGQASLAAGTAIGTIVFVVAVAFGLALLATGKPVPAPSRAMVLLPALTLVLGAAALANEVITRVEGTALVVAYLAYVAMAAQEGRIAVRAEETQPKVVDPRRLPWGLLVAGGVGLVLIGATLLIEGGVRLLDHTGLAAGFVGAAIVAALASLQQIFLEVSSLRRERPELATANLFGTVAAFSTGVLGLTALVRPLAVDSAVSSAFLAACILYTVVAVAFLARGRAGRLTGALVLLVYGAWLALASRI